MPGCNPGEYDSPAKMWKMIRAGGLAGGQTCADVSGEESELLHTGLYSCRTIDQQMFMREASLRCNN